MGLVDSTNATSSLLLPAPTETESTTPTELATEISRPADDKSSYSLPEDGTPVTIKTRHKANRSQTSLLIEYFEGGKGPSTSGSGGERKPSVRVRLTPSKNRKNDHIQITETKSRKTSLSRRAVPVAATASHLEGEGLSVLSGDGDDAYSMNSYASATEESNVSRQPIDIEIDRRRRRPASPLIPTAASSKASYLPGAMSDISAISAIPTDSFLDGEGPSSKTPEPQSSHTGDILAGAAAGLAAAAVADKMHSKSRSETKERVSLPKTRETTDRSERKSKSSRSRTASASGNADRDDGKSSRRRSGRSHQESAVSGMESSVMSSAMAPSYRSHDQQSVRSGASKASSINNPKLLETVEDAIRRLILPELNALKREQSRHKDRRGSVTSSATSASKEEQGGGDRRKSGGRDSNGKVKELRDKESRREFAESPAPSVSHESVDESVHESGGLTPGRSTDKLKTAAAAAAVLGGGLAAAALAGDKSPAYAREQRKRRREAKGRPAEKQMESYEESELRPQLQPPRVALPLMSSELNPSELTRASILSAETELDRPHSASEELTTPAAAEAARGLGSNDSSPTPTRQQQTLLTAIGTKHANVSQGDLRALPRTGTGGTTGELETDDFDREYQTRPPQQDDYDEYDEEAEEDMYHNQYGGQPGYNYYDTQDVPAPLRYEPYQLERRGLSPIPSVSGYTEGGSEVQQNRDSKVTHTTSGTFSSPGKSPHHERAPNSPPSSVPSNVAGREFDQDDSSALGYRNTTYTDDSELDPVSSGQAVRGIGAMPGYVHVPVGVESGVASLVDGSMLEESVLTADSGHGGHHYLAGPRGSMATLEEEASHGHPTPSRRSLEDAASARGARGDPAMVSPASPADTTGSHASAAYAGEYDLDQYGRKVSKEAAAAGRQHPTAAEAALAGAAVAAASQAIRKIAQERGKQPQVEDDLEEQDYAPAGAGVQRNKSFKERTLEGRRPANTPTHSVDRLMDYDDRPKMAASGLPDLDDPMPEIGYYDEVSNRSVPSVVEGPLGGSQHSSHDAREAHDAWSAGHRTPTQDRHDQYREKNMEPEQPQQRSGNGLGNAAAVAAGAAVLGGAAAAMASHSRQPSQEPDEDWRRTSDERKRDTLITNPYEGTSPNANMPGLGDNLLGSAPVFQNPAFAADYTSRSPLGHNKVDEGYISQGANKTPDIAGASDAKAKGVVGFTQPINLDDPFYAPSKGLVGPSRGLGTPLYDSATGEGIDNIESKDIIALMQHLAVRDAQRTARDTEILVTLVRSAAEMRDSFEKIKVMIADSEDVIIREVDENTDKAVQRAIGGPRPYPGSTAARSIQGAGGSQAGTDDLPTKKQNLFRRALKGLSAKGNNDLGRIEDMLMQLLNEVDVLKAQTAATGAGASVGAGMSPMSPTQAGGHSFDNLQNLQPAVQYEHDRGYEPEGNAGTSTASHASQSGHLSIPQSRNPSTKQGYERKFSDHRISTVPEANEDEYDSHHLAHHGYRPEMLGANVDVDDEMRRSDSVPLATPPQQHAAAGGAGVQPLSLSNDNTPRTDKSKKHKSSGSSNWFPKISRWSETTTSSMGRVFRNSRDSKKDADGAGEFGPPSRSGSDLGNYDEYGTTHDPYGDDHLHTGFSEHDLLAQAQREQQMMSPLVPQTQTPPHMASSAAYMMTPDEDPKYKAHRNSMNLQHPQPRPGQPYNAALERRVQAHDYESPRSPDWNGSATSLPRFPGGDARSSKRYSDVSASGEQQMPHPQYWGSSPAAVGPPKPPKEPLDGTSGPGHLTPPRTSRVSKLQKNSPLPYHSVESGYGTATQHGGSPRLENRNLSGALSNSGAPARRPSGPRAMTPKSAEEERERRRSKRDTFGTVASQESETF